MQKRLKTLLHFSVDILRPCNVFGQTLKGYRNNRLRSICLMYYIYLALVSKSYILTVLYDKRIFINENNYINIPNLFASSRFHIINKLNGKVIKHENQINGSIAN